MYIRIYPFAKSDKPSIIIIIIYGYTPSPIRCWSKGFGSWADLGWLLLSATLALLTAVTPTPSTTNPRPIGVGMHSYAAHLKPRRVAVRCVSGLVV